MSWKAQVLLVDDDAMIRRIVAHAMTAAGYRVLEAADGLSALAVAAEQRPEIIVLDVAMPGLDGFQTLAKLRQRGFGQPVLMLSSLHAVDDRLKGLGAGADDYIGKPFDMRELTARVDALLRRRPPAVRRLHFGDTVVDLERKTATRAGRRSRSPRRNSSYWRPLRATWANRFHVSTCSMSCGAITSRPARAPSKPMCGACAGNSARRAPPPAGSATFPAWAMRFPPT